ncbi:MAG: hypothetical protein JZD41_08695, partial [Thermoproteus sp.]|nr:hypothetical protein [Thermoproteus sp.]
VRVTNSVEINGIYNELGGSMQWVVEEALRQTGGRTPDVIADLGDWGKEPLITVLGKTPAEALEKALRIIRGA